MYNLYIKINININKQNQKNLSLCQFFAARKAVNHPNQDIVPPLSVTNIIYKLIER